MSGSVSSSESRWSVADLKTELTRKSEHHFELAARPPRLDQTFTANDVMCSLMALIVNSAKAEAFQEAATMCDRYRATEPKGGKR